MTLFSLLRFAAFYTRTVVYVEMFNVVIFEGVFGLLYSVSLHVLEAFANI